MMTVKQRNCSWRGEMMIYSDSMIAWQHTCNASRNTNDARPCGHSSLLALSARRRHIIDPGHFFTGGLPAERRGGRGVVPPSERRWGYRCGANTRSFTVDGAVATAENNSRSRIPMGVYGDNMIAHKSCLDVSSDPNEWSHSWEMRKRRKRSKNNNWWRWRCNKLILLGYKKNHRNTVTRGINENYKTKNKWKYINYMKFRILNVKY